MFKGNWSIAAFIFGHIFFQFCTRKPDQPYRERLTYECKRGLDTFLVSIEKFNDYGKCYEKVFYNRNEKPVAVERHYYGNDGKELLSTTTTSIFSRSRRVFSNEIFYNESGLKICEVWERLAIDSLARPFSTIASYSYDDKGRLIQRRISTSEFPDRDEECGDYVYDTRSRLVRIDYDGNVQHNYRDYDTFMYTDTSFLFWRFAQGIADEYSELYHSGKTIYRSHRTYTNIRSDSRSWFQHNDRDSVETEILIRHVPSGCYDGTSYDTIIRKYVYR